MTPKEKANELYSKFDNLFNKDFMLPIVYDNQLKKCALIAVDSILQSLKYPPKPNEHRQVVHIETLKYWQEVKQEIEKL
jgi:hypothetical protein